MVTLAYQWFLLYIKEIKWSANINEILFLKFHVFVSDIYPEEKYPEILQMSQLKF